MPITNHHNGISLIITMALSYRRPNKSFKEKKKKSNNDKRALLQFELIAEFSRKNCVR